MTASHPRRRNADYRWTKPKILAFLRALGESGSVTAAARAVGMSRQSAYRLRQRITGLGVVWRECETVGRRRRFLSGLRGQIVPIAHKVTLPPLDPVNLSTLPVAQQA